jgi:hypothetical protein
MKNIFVYRQVITILSAAVVLAIFVTRPASAQEKAKADGKKTVKIKITKEDNGKTTVIDTVFYADSPLDAKEMQAVMQKAENEMKEAHKQMKQMRFEIALSSDDSASAGSEGKRIMKVYSFGGDEDSPEGDGGEFNYSFNVPCHPECMEMQECMEQMNWEGAGNKMQFMHPGSQGSTLSDLLGDIPMERVKSYSIKDRKNGKRIIIDIDDAPLMEKQDRMIYIQGNPPHQSAAHVQMRKVPREVKVIVNTDDEKDKPEKSE